MKDITIVELREIIGWLKMFERLGIDPDEALCMLDDAGIKRERVG